MRAWTLVCCFAVAALVAGCGGDGKEAAPTTAATTTAPAPRPDSGLFADDHSVPLAVRDQGVVNPRYPVKIHAVTFSDGRGGRIRGYLVVPPGSGRRPGVVYVHGSGGTLLDLLAPATWLAGRRAVALSIDLPALRASSSGGSDPVEVVGRERDLTAANIVAMRRALDVLAARPDVDPSRLGYVGFSAGARLGAILAGVDHRLKAAALVSGGAAPVDAYVKEAPAASRTEIRSLLSSVDPLRYVASAAPATLLFQDGRKDTVVPRADLTRLARAASRPKEVRWYPSGHSPTNRVWREQLDWLQEKLPISGAPVPRALTGPTG